jgi:hypothetical protein
VKTPIKTTPTILGTAYTIRAGSKTGKDAYYVTLLMGDYGTPAILMGKSITPIDQPWRFGSWSTPAERRAYIRKFVEGWDDAQAAWDAIPCSACGKSGNPCDCPDA